MRYQLVVELGQARLAVVVEHQHRVDHLVCALLVTGRVTNGLCDCRRARREEEARTMYLCCGWLTG